MNIRANRRYQKQMDSAQAAYDAMLPDDDDECIDDDFEPDFEAMIEAKKRD